MTCGARRAGRGARRVTVTRGAPLVHLLLSHAFRSQLDAPPLRLPKSKPGMTLPNEKVDELYEELKNRVLTALKPELRSNRHVCMGHGIYLKDQSTK